MLIYKIIAEATWLAAQKAGVFAGAAIDLSDGYIHLSTATQAEETARRHFSGQTGLLLVAYDTAKLGDHLRWEASRGGDLFPHVYGTLNPAQAEWAKPLPLINEIHVFPEGWA